MIAEIALPIPLAKTFSYSVPEKLKPHIRPFQRVMVPFRNYSSLGFVIDTIDTNEEGLKEVSKIIDLYPLIDENIKDLCAWASMHYVTPIGLVLKYAIPKYLNPQRYIYIEKKEGCHDGHLIDISGKSLEKAYNIFGIEIIKYIEKDKIVLFEKFTKKRFSFAYDLKKTRFHTPEKIVFLGNIENRIDYYLNAIETHIKNNNNVLMLLPDYELSKKFFYKILTQRFGEKVFWYGSSVRQNQRMETYFRAKGETGNIILGNKSCIFLPISSLSLIIVERHEEDSFRNESEFKFNAWEVAVKRSEIEGASIILGSVAPTIEVYHKIEKGTFKVVKASLPRCPDIYELKINKKTFFSEGVPDELEKILEDNVAHKRQTVIFTPRKYYSAQLQCVICGYLFVCPKCRSILNYKKAENKTICINCQYEDRYSELCPHCRSNIIRFFQFGAEYIGEKLKDRFSNTEIGILTGDNISEGTKEHIEKILNKDIIVGTYILSKLYHIKCDTLILLWLEDLLNIAGYRAEEKLFQLIFNMFDALSPKKVYLFVDEKKVFTIKRFKDYYSFYKTELEKRKIAEFPPFKNIYVIEIKKKSLKAGQRILKDIKFRIEASGLKDAMKGPLFEKRDGYIWKILLKDSENINDLLFSLYNIQNVVIEKNPLRI